MRARFPLLLLAFLSLAALLRASPCRRECDTRLSLDEDDFDVACNETCKILKCYEGCDLWTEAISSTCHDVCEEEIKVFKKKSSLYCVRGCNIAINLYIESIEEKIGTPSAPYLVAESRTPTSISIKWSPSQLGNISYLVQFRHDGLHSSDWEYYQPFNLLKQNNLKVEGLQPYTKYRFRIAWILLENYSPLFSEESFVISTLPFGVPSTSPVITCLTAVSCCRVSVSWNPPSQPNGPILSYVLYIREYSTGTIMIKDVSDTSDELHYMINNLKPSTLYVISLSTRNTKGEGPADVRNITTFPEKPTSKFHYPPAYLVFAAKNQVMKQGIRIIDNCDSLYHTENSITMVTGIALNVKQNSFFVSHSNGSIYSISLRNETNINPLIDLNETLPSSLSYDWLNEKLYIVEDDQISRCDTSGQNYEVVISSLKFRPEDIHVDPLNGYLYWVMRDPTTKGGLYRIDLFEFESGCVPSEKAELIINDGQLMAFTLDYKNFRLLLPSSTNHTIISIALDGSDVADVRANSHTQLYQNIKSMAVHQDLLYWTTGEKLLREEYQSSEKKYYQNSFFMVSGPLLALNLHHSDYQPHPVPMNPVESVEALFGHDRTRIRWSSPRRLAGEGKGSYKKWLYELHLSEHNSHHILIQPNITANSIDISGLTPNATYSVKLRAYSEGGKGPWSSSFLGTTLDSKSKDFTLILWGAQDGLLKSNVIGEETELLIHKININNAKITDICSYSSMLFINTNTSFIYVHNTSVHNSLTRLQNITQASGIALDWFAPKLYWSSPAQQLISRSNLDGSQPEALPVLTMAKDIAIDSMNAYLYYATSHSVERSRLNGQDHFVYMENALFSGKHVMGLTLNFENKHIYWMVRSFEGSLMYRSCVAVGSGDNCMPEEPEIIREIEEGLYGPLWYYSNRLYWLHEKQRAFVSDVSGKNFAEIYGPGLNSLSTLEIIDPSLQVYPEGFTADNIKVIPASVVESDIHIAGTSDQFNITWEPDFIVNYGTVFYEIRVDDGDEVYNVITSDTVFVYPTMKYLNPYTSLTIAVQPFTYYASARQTIVYRYSPMSVPSKPLQPRVFISHKSSPLMKYQDIVATFRWLPPKETNGVILSYRVSCWFINNEARVQACGDVVNGKTLEYQNDSLHPNTTYYFQVAGATEAGYGEPSDVVEVETSVERPIPQLLLANSEEVKVTDIDSHEERLLYSKAVHPAAVAYLSRERKVFWIEENSLVASSLDNNNTALIKHLTSEGTCLTVDWIGRNLYWAEVNKKEGFSSIMGVDLSYINEPKKILNHSSVITSLEVEPFSGSLIWTLASDNSCNLMISDLSGSNTRPFFERHFEYEPIPNKSKVKRMTEENISCNCVPYIKVGPVISIDTTNKRPQILFVDGKYGHIWASDVEGCMCSLVLNATENRNNGLPPTSLTADNAFVYWSNATVGKVYSIPKPSNHFKTDRKLELLVEKESSLIASEKVPGIRSIRAIGDHLQPFPDPKCLLFGSYRETAKLLSRSSDSLTLYLPPIARPEYCSRISFPAVLYTLYYAPSEDKYSVYCYQRSIDNCTTSISHQNEVTIANLEPYTMYTIRISVKNYYSDETIALGPPAEYRTSEGAPSKPLNVTAIPVTPTRIDVTWEPPSHLNGPSVSYVVFWKKSETGMNTFSLLHSECGKDSALNELSFTIDNLEPGSKYYVMVRAYSFNCTMMTDSDEASVDTYSLPSPFTLETALPKSISLMWPIPDPDIISHYYLEYKETDELDWHQEVLLSSQSNYILFEINNLTPKTRYNIRVVMTYIVKNVKFEWPRSSFFEFLTAGDVPSVPGSPQVKIWRREEFQIFWYSSVNYGYEDIVYELQMSLEESDAEFEDWKTVYNGSDTEWNLGSVSPSYNYEFRVRASNEFGSSNYSYTGKPFYLPELGAYVESVDGPVGIAVASCIAITIILIMVLSGLYIMQMRKREKNKKILQDVVTPNQLLPDLELATLQDLPLHANFVHQTNTLYNLSDVPSDEDLLSLPQVQRHQIILTKFLGCGAFGEVFEGVVYELNESTSSLKIAVKTLKKGASEHVKEEFLKEAKLMSNFKHEHILQLLGVCFDNNPNFIILELMEGGDLLSYLRGNRPTVYQSSNLTMDDLIGICVDVAKGCKYLEDMHFVHRDLAARNCLVSSHDRNERIVKIGDFGLARDIYKNDYYRKAGEALLPVRWMAPESLVYGVFTSYSDVWAFGVLLWEVITLGQQPYPARSNIEVLHFVRAGGRLDKPQNCPDDLYDVMANCWNYDAENRPTFMFCLNALKELKDKLDASTMILPVVYNFNYLNDTNIGTYIGRYDYDQRSEDKLQDNFDTRSTQSDPPASTEMDENNISVVGRSFSWTDAMFEAANNISEETAKKFLKLPGRRMKNKYIELLGDNEDSDGYQLPLQPHASSTCANSNIGEIGKVLVPFSKTQKPFKELPSSPPPDEVDKSPESNFNIKNGEIVFSDELVDNEIRKDFAGISELSGLTFEDFDNWSLSTASTATCHLESSADSNRNNCLSALSNISGIDLRYSSNSSFC